MKTFMAKNQDASVRQKQWFVADVKNKILGRAAARIATVIRGKHKAIYTPHVDVGDHVVVVNAGKIRVTGRKLQEKQYLRFSGYPGGLKSTSLDVMLKTKPTEVIRRAVRRMLPAGPLSRRMLKKLEVYTGEDHPHKTRNLKTLEV
ncbi:MAG: 50S ribosomal protein L13 [Candidatus Omnitrophota bacterium]